MSIEIVPLDETAHFVKALIYGDSGVGKTVLAGTSPKPLIIDVEGGTLSLRQFGIKADVVRVKDFSAMREIRDELQKTENQGRWETVIIDSLTELQRRSMEAVMKLTVAQNSKRDPDVPGIGEYGKNGEVIRKVIRQFRDLPMHVIFVCLQLDMTDSDTGLPIARPMLQGKLASEVPQYMDMVGHLTVRQSVEEGNVRKDRVLNIDHGGRFSAKNRLGGLPPQVVNPNFSEIISRSLGAPAGELKLAS